MQYNAAALFPCISWHFYILIPTLPCTYSWISESVSIISAPQLWIHLHCTYVYITPHLHSCIHPCGTSNDTIILVTPLFLSEVTLYTYLFNFYNNATPATPPFYERDTNWTPTPPQPTAGSSKTRLYKRFVKYKLYNITRYPKYCITNIKLLREYIWKLNIHMDNTENIL